MRWWISGIASALLIVLFTLIVWREQKTGGACYEQRNAQNTERPEAKSLIPGAVDSLPSEQESPQQTYSSGPNPESYLCGLIAPANLPTIYLVLIGISGIVVAIGTLEILEKQTDATNNAANAALLNAQAVINSERAWMLLHKSLRPDGPHPDWEFEARVQNFGKTPARIIALKIEHQIGGRDAPPNTTIFEKSELLIATLLPQGECVEYPFSVRELLNNDRHLWICGAIRYQDVLAAPESPIHETFFCRRFEPLRTPRPGWVPGPDKYNGAT